MSLTFLNSVARCLRQTQPWRPFATIFVMGCAHADPRRPRYFKVKHKPYYNIICTKNQYWPMPKAGKSVEFCHCLASMPVKHGWQHGWQMSHFQAAHSRHTMDVMHRVAVRGPGNTIYTENQHLIVIFRQSVHRLMTSFLRQNKKASFCIVGRRTRGLHLGSINPKANIWFTGS